MTRMFVKSAGLFLLAGAMALTGCTGEKGEKGDTGAQGSNCTIEGNLIRCGTSTFAVPQDGQDGQDCTLVDNLDATATITCGSISYTVQNGADGQDCAVVDNLDGTATITCGAVSYTVQNGAAGAGCTMVDLGATAEITCGAVTYTVADGTDGQDGAGCTMVDNLDNTATITCGAAIYTVSNGTDGQDGAGCTMVDNGATATITCGATTYTVADGTDGQDGAGCTMVDNGATATITCGATTYTVADGADGAGCTMVDNLDGTATITCGATSYTVLGGADLLADVRPESCSVCHRESGTDHQAIYNKYTDASTLVATIDAVNVTDTSGTGVGPWDVAVDLSIDKGGVPYVADIATFAQKTVYVTKYDRTTKLFQPSKSLTTRASNGDGTYTISGTGLTFDPTASDAMVYAYFVEVGAPTIVPPKGNYKLYEDVASVAQVFGTIDYVSAANLSACQNCHGTPYMKHGYRAAVVAGLPDMVACKACHHDQRVGSDFDWQVLANDPAALASITANGTQDANWKAGYGLAVAANYQYVANVMNDTHMSHAMEFAYPQSIANCATCHAGKLDVVLADSKFVGTTCKSCHATTRTGKDDAKRAPSFDGELLHTALQYHAFNWADGTILHDVWDSVNAVTIANAHVACNYCHSDTASDCAGTGGGAADGVGPTCYGAQVPLFKDLHRGYNDAIYDANGVKYAGAIATTVTSATYDPATKKITAQFTMTGLAANAIAKPTLVVSLYGFGTKDFVVSGHSSQFTDKTPNLEWSEGALIRGTTKSANTSRLTVTPATAAAGTTTWTAVADLTTWGPMIGTTVVKAEVAFLPQVGVDQTIAPQCDSTKAAFNLCIATSGATATVDLLSGTQDLAMYGKNIVSTAKCNKCHDALAVEFHSPNYGSAGVSACRLCHFVGTGGSHLEMQSRSIDSYVHAIHAFQKMDINGVDFSDPVQAMEYMHHIESTYPNFTTLSCESCHNPGTYDVADQTKSMPGILSASSVLTGKSRAIGSVPSVVTGPAARACGSCHRAELIKEDDAFGLNAFDKHTEAFGYRQVPTQEKSPGVLETTYDVLLRLVDALF